MAERSIERMTLREKFTEAERLTRELTEHLDRGFIPKVGEVARLIRPIADHPERASDVEDITVRNYAAEVLEREDFTRRVYDKLSEYCGAIQQDVSRIVNEG